MTHFQEGFEVRTRMDAIKRGGGHCGNLFIKSLTAFLGGISSTSNVVSLLDSSQRSTPIMQENTKIQKNASQPSLL